MPQADVPPGELGEIVHRSPQLLSGYWQKSDETRAAFIGGWFHSGDLGYADEEGFIYVVDRVKDVTFKVPERPLGSKVGARDSR